MRQGFQFYLLMQINHRETRELLPLLSEQEGESPHHYRKTNNDKEFRKLIFPMEYEVSAARADGIV